MIERHHVARLFAFVERAALEGIVIKPDTRNFAAGAPAMAFKLQYMAALADRPISQNIAGTER